MKKDKLIELLQSIEGNPDIYIWNGYVEDYMDISKDLNVIKTGVESLEFVTNGIKWERAEFLKRELTPEENLSMEKLAKKLKKNRKREMINPHVEDECLKIWYGNSIKNAYLLNPLTRGLTSYGRDGGLKY